MANIITGKIKDNFNHNVEASNAMMTLTGGKIIAAFTRDSVVKNIEDNDAVFEAMRIASKTYITSSKITKIAEAIALRSKTQLPEMLYLQDILVHAIADALAE